jgi:aspartyl-tRNA(Asn)/glutamyl-tRNA(Gln) amidotransferase subunit A
VRGLRIGFVRHFHERDMIADGEVAAALEDVARVLTREGATVRTTQLPPLSELAAVRRVIMEAEAWAIHSNWLIERPADYARTTRRRLLAGAFFSAGDYVRAQQHRLQMIAAVDDAFVDADVLLTVNAMEPACRIDDADAVLRTYPRNARTPFNMTGHPAIALMCGLSSTGLPLSVQFVGRTYDEATLLRVAATYESASEWRERRPAI